MSYVQFFLNSASTVIQYELIEITHPSFSKPYRIVRNALNGLTVTLEDSTVATFDYYPLSIKVTGASQDLDQSIEAQLGDLGDIIPKELDLVAAADNFKVKPTLLYRTYRSDDLSAPMNGPVRLEVPSLSFKKEGASITAGAPKLNASTTGEIYTMDRFPMLRGFL